MPVLRELPENYVLKSRFSAKDTRALLIMNIAGFFLLAFFIWLFSALSYWMRPSETLAALSFTWGGWQPLVAIVGFLVLMVVVVLIHEAIHGLFFWWLGGVRPVFAFRGAYAYAAAPGAYLPRDRYLFIGIAPLLLISILCVVLLAVVPVRGIAPVLLAGVINGAGAVGDLWVVFLLLRQTPQALAEDEGEEVRIYAPRSPF